MIDFSSENGDYKVAFCFMPGIAIEEVRKMLSSYMGEWVEVKLHYPGPDPVAKFYEGELVGVPSFSTPGISCGQHIEWEIAHLEHYALKDSDSKWPPSFHHAELWVSKQLPISRRTA